MGLKDHLIREQLGVKNSGARRIVNEISEKWLKLHDVYEHCLRTAGDVIYIYTLSNGIEYVYVIYYDTIHDFTILHGSRASALHCIRIISRTA